jgi:zinc/manganese transport system substrate-binding protein
MDRRSVLLGLLAGFLGSNGLVRAQEQPIEAVASFTILADFVREVGGERVRVVSLVPENGDAHVFEPKPSDAKTIARARLLVVNGLGFDGWAERLARSVRYSGALVVAGRKVRRVEIKDDPHGHRHGHGHDRTDPHGWQDPKDAKTYVEAIRDGLVGIDPAGRANYEKRASDYLAKLEALDAEIRTLLAPIPPDRRRIVTAHDAFARFGKAYGIEFVGIHGISTESAPSAKDVAAVIARIRKEKAWAVFLENMGDERIVRRIAQETGAKIGGTLYGDALGGDVRSYIDLMRHNASAIAEALR